MGCDIHLFVEVREAEGRWRSADVWKELAAVPGEPTYEGDFVLDAMTPGARVAVRAVFDDRNYDIFTILAGVRPCPCDGCGAEIEADSFPSYRGTPPDLSGPVDLVMSGATGTLTRG